MPECGVKTLIADSLKGLGARDPHLEAIPQMSTKNGSTVVTKKERKEKS